MQGPSENRPHRFVHRPSIFPSRGHPLHQPNWRAGAYALGLLGCAVVGVGWFALGKLWGEGGRGTNSLSQVDALVALLEARDRITELCISAKQRSSDADIKPSEMQVWLPFLLPQMERMRHALPALSDHHKQTGIGQLKPCLTHEGTGKGRFGHGLGLTGMERLGVYDDKPTSLGWGTAVECAEHQLVALDDLLKQPLRPRPGARSMSWQHMRERMCQAQDSLVAVLNAETEKSREQAEFRRRFNDLVGVD